MTSGAPYVADHVSAQIFDSVPISAARLSSFHRVAARRSPSLGDADDKAVLNALVHRDYFLRRSIHLTLHDSQAEITSPGGFTGGVTARNVPRNPLFADVLQAIGLVNRAGLGVDRIYEELLLPGKDLPRDDEAKSHIRLVLPTRTHARFVRFVRFVHEVRRGGGELGLDDLILLRGLTRRGSLNR